MGSLITAGFTVIGRGNWSGGETYLRNMLGVIASELVGRVEAKLFLSPEQAEKVGSSMDRFLSVPPIVDRAVARFGKGKSAFSAILTGSNPDAARIFSAEKVDVVFEAAQFYGNHFPIPVVSWAPDFQHRNLPHLFSNAAWWRRDLGFRLQTSGKRTIMLSSFDAKRDCETHYPASVGKTAVVRFAIDIDPGEHLDRRAEIIARYGLPARFYYLPNQFWSHKNHAVVVRALALVASRRGLAGLPPVVLTGRTDPRDPEHFKRLMNEAATAGVISHFRHLGLVPYEDVLGLNACSDTLINPSLCEGWSTTVEEAKAFGTRMILSDIGLHREQAPDARFFNPDRPEELAEALVNLAGGRALERAPTVALREAHAKRRRDYADALEKTFIRAVNLRSQ